MTVSEPGSLIVVGAGPGIGASVARRFGREGHPVGLIARNGERLEGMVRDLEDEGVTAAAVAADVSRPSETAVAVSELIDRLGPPGVLCFSPLADVDLIKPVLETSPEDFDSALGLTAIGAVAAARSVIPEMRKAGTGTLLFTTGSAAINPSHERAVSGVVYAAEGSYIAMLGEALAPEGVHVAQTVIVGPVGPGKKHEPDSVAEHLWQRHVKKDDLLTIME